LTKKEFLEEENIEKKETARIKGRGEKKPKECMI